MNSFKIEQNNSRITSSSRQSVVLTSKPKTEREEFIDIGLVFDLKWTVTKREKENDKMCARDNERKRERNEKRGRGSRGARVRRRRGAELSKSAKARRKTAIREKRRDDDPVRMRDIRAKRLRQARARARLSLSLFSYRHSIFLTVILSRSIYPCLHALPISRYIRTTLLRIESRRCARRKLNRAINEYGLRPK